MSGKWRVITRFIHVLSQSACDISEAFTEGVNERVARREKAPLTDVWSDKSEAPLTCLKGSKIYRVTVSVLFAQPLDQLSARTEKPVCDVFNSSATAAYFYNRVQWSRARGSTCWRKMPFIGLYSATEGGAVSYTHLTLPTNHRV